MTSKEFMYLDLRVLKWAKHNARSDIKHPTWFRVDVRIIDEPDLADFNDAEKWAWIYILAMCCRKNSDEIRVNFTHARRVSRIKTKNLISAIQKLERNQSIEVISRPLQTDRQDKTRQDITDTPERSSPPAIRDSSEALPEFSGISEIIRERKITERVQRAWIEAFPDTQWVLGEVKKALAWESANPNRRKRNFGAFMTNWMNRGWDRRSVAPKSRTISEILAEEDSSS